MTAPAPEPIDIQTYLNFLIGSTPIAGTAGSDELNRAYMAANAQRYAAAMQGMTQLATQDQANQVRWAELMGASPGGTPTDTARRWRDELQAQRDIQNARMRQEFAQLMGYSVDANGNVNYGAPTLQSRQLTQEAQQAELARAQQLQLQREQQYFQTGERAGTQAFQTGERTGTQAFQTGERLGTETFQRGESALERAMRERMQQAEIGATAQQSELERQLRRDLQSGQLGQQEAEFARTYILQQEQSRRQQAELGGYMVDAQGNATGTLTEAARATREQERTQRAALAAQLMQAPKDVFRAGAYFRNMAGQGGDPYAMGLTGGGIAGFNSMAQRASGTPGSATLEDVESMPGMGSSVGNTNPQEMQAMSAPGAQAQAQAMTGTPEAPSAAGGVSAAQTLGEGDDDVPGMGPAGPVGRGGRGRQRRRGPGPGPDWAEALGGAQGRNPQLDTSAAMNRWAQALQNQMGKRSDGRGTERGRGDTQRASVRKAQTTGAGRAGAQDQIRAQLQAMIQGQQAQQAQAAQAAAVPPTALPTAPTAPGDALTALMGGGAPAAAAPAASVMPAVPTAPAAPVMPAVPTADPLTAMLGGGIPTMPNTGGEWRQVGMQPPSQGGFAPNVQNDRWIDYGSVMPSVPDDQIMRAQVIDPATGATRIGADPASRWRQLMTPLQGGQGGQDELVRLLQASDPSAEKRAALAPGGMGSEAWAALQQQRNPDTGSIATQEGPAEVRGGTGFGMGGGTEPSTSSEGQSPSALGGSTSSGSGSEDEAATIPGLTPGGPVGDPLTDLIRNGMGAGGNFQSRAAPDSSAPGVIPYVDPSVLQEPAVQEMIRDVREQGVRDDANGRRGKGQRGKSGPSGPSGEALIYDAQEADRRRWSDERFLQGLSSLNRRGVLGRPGAGPAGPGDLPAPLYPEGGGTAAPTVPTASSVGGGGSSFNLAAAASPTPAPASPGLGGMDPANQQAAIDYAKDMLLTGVGNQDAQFLQKMSSTQRGNTEGALQALGLSWDDFTEAVAQTRFQNVGNVLSA